MEISVQILKDLPTKQIERFEDRCVYNMAKSTREYTSRSNTYPYKTGKLRSSESHAPIVGSNKEYGLVSGTNYGVYVWNMTNVNWTNSNTQPQWYYNNFRSKGALLTLNAVMKSLKEI